MTEAESPKNALRHASSRKIWPSDAYYLNLWHEGKSWKDGEFCPGMVDEDSEFEQFDGMYGLIDDVYQAMGVERTPTPEEEERFGQEYSRYMDPIYAAIKKGTTKGSVDGIAGRINWQLVYGAFRGNNNWNAWINSVEAVEPGKQYGARLAREEALQLAERVLEGEDPKSVFKQMRGYDKVEVVIEQWKAGWMGGNHEQVGTFSLRSDGAVLGERLPKDFDKKLIKRIYRDLQRGQYHGNLFRTPFSWHVKQFGGFDHNSGYKHDSARSAIQKFKSSDEPILIIETPNWTLRTPAVRETEHGQLVWSFGRFGTTLTPEQRAFMEEHGEMIWYAMNEGPSYEDDITDEDDEVIGHWRIEGDVDLAPEINDDNWGYY